MCSFYMSAGMVNILKQESEEVLDVLGGDVPDGTL